MADLLLTHGYFLAEDEKEREIMRPYPTLGLLYLSAFLSRAGFSVEVFDTTFATREALFARLAEGPGVVGIYTNLMTRAGVLAVTREARRLGWTVVLGGPESASWSGEYLERGAHVIVAGEGETPMAALLPALAREGPHRLHAVPGILFRDEEGRTVETPPAPQIADLDTLPFPDRDAIDCGRYVDVWRAHHGAGSLNLITARGCPYRCNWCSHAVFGFTHRRRRPGAVADELSEIVERWRPDQVWYADDVFTIRHRWLFEYEKELSRRGLKVPFETISRADRLMSEEVLATLARMGCARIWIGSESGSQRILDAMERGVTAEQVRWATKAAQRHGIQVGMFLMWGYEGETEEDIAATVEHVKAASPDVFFTTVSYPIKGTGYFEKVKERVVPGAPWENGSDRDHKVRGRHARGYYKLADQWLKNDVAAFRMESADPEGAAERRAAALAARVAMRAFSELEG